jgi:uncharacterized membrane protein YvbJ
MNSIISSILGIVENVTNKGGNEEQLQNIIKAQKSKLTTRSVIMWLSIMANLVLGIIILTKKSK